ncbi:hypothetical protein RHGRI_016546 [Rhododendron griersonianum]|uniref:Uncharacterized protein n=1 Tax=Rhododendron griersonianum TaxID=479676 RepID=A0AAV6JUK2_9ERIC|nr:hypothetical protein RHGRI_016546 [Rhododendron griersonianum]
MSSAALDLATNSHEVLIAQLQVKFKLASLLLHSLRYHFGEGDHIQIFNILVLSVVYKKIEQRKELVFRPTLPLMDIKTVSLEYEFDNRKELGKSMNSKSTPFKGSARFSNSKAGKLVDAVIYRCKDEKTAEILMEKLEKLQDLDLSPFLRPRFLQQNESSCHVVGGKVDGDRCSLEDWCKKNYLSFWRRYPSDSANCVSLGEPSTKLFCKILNGLNAYHEKGIAHGNLKYGIMISKENRVILYNENSTVEGNVGGISSDLEDFLSIVREAVAIVHEAWMLNGLTVLPPPSFEAFVELYRDLLLYQQDMSGIRDVDPSRYNHLELLSDVCDLALRNVSCSTRLDLYCLVPVTSEKLYVKTDQDMLKMFDSKIWRFEFFIRNNPFFLDITGSYLMFNKILDYRDYNNANFHICVRLLNGATDMKHWYSQLTHPELKKVGRRNVNVFHTPYGLPQFLIDIYGHGKRRGNKIDNGTITLNLRDGLPKLLPRLFLEFVREIDQDPRGSEFMCGRLVFGWFGFSFSGNEIGDGRLVVGMTWRFGFAVLGCPVDYKTVFISAALSRSHGGEGHNSSPDNFDDVFNNLDDITDVDWSELSGSTDEEDEV